MITENTDRRLTMSLAPGGETGEIIYTLSGSGQPERIIFNDIRHDERWEWHLISAETENGGEGQ
jgi:hypothetical protein